MCFPEIGSLAFPEFWHGAGNPFEVFCDRAGVFRRNFFLLQRLGNRLKLGLFEFKEKFGH